MFVIRLKCFSDDSVLWEQRRRKNCDKRFGQKMRKSGKNIFFNSFSFGVWDFIELVLESDDNYRYQTEILVRWVFKLKFILWWTNY